jgi:hypothetical protein
LSTEKFGTATVFCSTERFGIYQRSDFKSTVFVLPRRGKFWILPTKTRNCLHFVQPHQAQLKFLESPIGALYFIRSRSENIWNSPTKATRDAWILFLPRREKFRDLSTKATHKLTCFAAVWNCVKRS